MRVILKHVCNSPLYGGNPGDVVEVPDAVGKSWILDDGAIELPKGEDLTPAKKRAPKK